MTCIYAIFLNLDEEARKELKSKGIYTSLVTKIISKDKIQNFKVLLKNRIEEELRTSGKIKLRTDYVPKGILDTVFKDATPDIQFNHFIPFNTCVTIKLENNSYLLDLHLGNVYNKTIEEYCDDKTIFKYVSDQKSPSRCDLNSTESEEDLSDDEELLPPLSIKPVIDYVKKFKDFPAEMDVTFSFTPMNQDEIINKIASYLSIIYTTFLDLDEPGRDELRKKGIQTSLNTKNLPNLHQCGHYQKRLKELITKTLKANKTVLLSTTLAPESILEEAFYGGNFQEFDCTDLIPFNSTTWVNRKENSYHLSMKLKKQELS